VKVLVTGGTGFIGGHLARALRERGDRVRVLARRPAPELTAQGLEVVQGDITDRAAVQAAVQGMDLVYHLAALRDRWGWPYSLYQAVNVAGTRHLLEAAAAEGCRFVHCSSVGVALYPGNRCIDETLPYHPASSQRYYHQTKAQAERLVLERARRGEVAATVVRPVITYGPGDERGMVTRMMALLARGRFIPVGRGRNHVHLAYIDDVVQGFLLAGAKPDAVGQAYIIAGPRSIAVKELIRLTCAVLGVPRPRLCVPTPLALAVAWVWEALYQAVRSQKEPLITRDKIATLTVDRGFNWEKAHRELGYAPQVDYEEGLGRTAAWFRMAYGG